MGQSDFADNTLGVIFRGGRSRRLGVDKAMARLGEDTLLEAVAERLRPQSARIVLSVSTTNQVPEGWHGVPDRQGGGGPLLALLDTMLWAQEKTDFGWLVTTPVDTPFLPSDLAVSLCRAAQEKGSRSAVARSGGRVHGLSAIYDLSLAGEVERIVLGEGERMLTAFHEALGSAIQDWDAENADPFLNINHAEDLDRARKRAAGYPTKSSS